MRRGRRMNKGRLIAAVVGVVVVGGVFVFVLPQIADYRAVWDTIAGLTWPQVGALAVAELANLATFAPPYVATLPGLGYWRASVIAQASTASTYVAPGGAAVGIGLAFAMLRGWGFTPAAVTLAVTLTGLWNQLFMLVAPAVALALLTFAGGSNTTLKIVAVFAVLVVCLRTLGVGADEVTFTEAFAGWTFVRLLGSLPITPGGIGIVELGLTGALVGFGGANDEVVAAVLLYRVLTVVPTLVLGVVAGALWRRLRPEAAEAALSDSPARAQTAAGASPPPG